MQGPFRAYDGDDSYVFVCYSHDDAAAVFPELVRLRRAGFHIWYDEGISPGSEWTASIAEHIEGCDAFLFFVTPRAAASDHCRREVAYALDQSCAVLAVHLEPTELPSALKFGLNNRQAIYGYELPQPVYREKLDVALSGAASGRSGDVRIETAGRSSRSKPRFRIPALLTALVLAVIALAVAYREHFIGEQEGVPARLRVAVASIGYLPDTPDMRNYATAFRAELIHNLSRLSAQFPFDVVDSADAAEFLARGSMGPLADGVRLNVQVARTGTTLWTGSLDLPAEPTEETLAVWPERLANLVSTVMTSWSWAANATDSDEAMREFIAGSIEYNEAVAGLGGDFNASVTRLKRAVQLDPHFIPAMLLLGNHYKNRLNGKLRYADAIEPAREYARKVLAVDENFTTLAAEVNTTLELDYAAAQANLEHARRAGFPPGFVEFPTALNLLPQGRLEEAIEGFNTALKVASPGNEAASYLFIAYARYMQGKFATAAQAAKTAITQSAGTGGYAEVPAAALHIKALYHAGDEDAARAALRSAWASYGEGYPEWFAGAVALAGDAETASRILTNAETRYAAGMTFSFRECFWGYYYLGDLDRAFVWLERAIRNRDIGVIAEMKRSGLLDPIRDDPRFIAAMALVTKIEAEGTRIRTVAWPSTKAPETDAAAEQHTQSSSHALALNNGR